MTYTKEEVEEVGVGESIDHAIFDLTKPIIKDGKANLKYYL
ncbi:MAG: hypothetical protein ACJ708_12020 [Nitrososphaeraceae archaeon]|jgi:hypothetical protein